MEDLMGQGMRYANQVLILKISFPVCIASVKYLSSPDALYCNRPFFLDAQLVVFLPYFTVMSSVDCFHRTQELNALLMLECFLTRRFTLNHNFFPIKKCNISNRPYAVLIFLVVGK
jgi:hypothetical protein